MSPFDYLLNAFEEASQSPEPATLGYGEKRRKLLDYVHDLERRAYVNGWKRIDRSLVTYPVRIQRQGERGDREWREREDGAVFEFELPPLPTTDISLHQQPKEQS